MLGLFPHLDPYDPMRRPPLLVRWRRAWRESLRFRLLAVGLPLLIVFPLILAFR